ncbi:class I SAM-dependent methyltransferase [Methanobacterium alcaliphilum]|uniref:class I SAM-dependent methyltransferase n=1 Tax=Methanobacterium alcaliphilum TaxID=392018 RepID=UPI00200A9260|nr:class I SAM-dependent methyltransferase [Methanobacterium alcaliphilum]MCK9151634.1 class I SAM-dependent methyltransferase [Methanobacterium alcaliphilum]
MKCTVCNNEINNTIFNIKEMMFGYKTVFRYFECHECGCLQLIDVPEDFSKYYAFKDYYSFKNDGIMKKFLKRKWIQYVLFKNSIIGKILSKKFKKSFFDIVALQNISKKTKILDVGCGSGDLIVALDGLGFDNVLGIDPYLEQSSEILKKKNINHLDDADKFDLILFDHSFEHISDQSGTLNKIFNLLSEEGVCLIGMPIKNDYIWDLYGVNWVQIDAPRHVLLHTLKSFKILVEKSGLKICDIIFNSNELLFYGSEQYKQDIPLMDKKSYLINPERSIFSKKDIENFKTQSHKLNQKKSSDQCVFILKRDK